ncbi:MAG: FKBP-type peptidyl-prolyl cis-trans isomerase [Bacteroidales bacterium]|nr:FKBP-type peptidyl-prolyl cis-trans isomerase [Bacteroidales bacterium]MDT8374166.1 FKBP-type peptidyl-prolyl cis-trans isomerase [Bacteroidales bacterium]
MKIKGLVILAVAASMIASSCNTRSSITGTKLKSAEDSLAYAIGIANYFYFMSDSLEIDPVLFAKGMIDAENEKNTLDEQTAQGYVMTYMQNRQADQMKKAYGKNIDEGENFLAENKKREGVQETSSGLQYEVITMGTGDKPGPQDMVKVHYTGMLLDSTKFDSSLDRGEPAQFGVNQVITGWQEGIQLMPVGSKFKFYIPYELGYGEQGTGPIPPYSTLLFEVELLEIVKE